MITASISKDANGRIQRFLIQGHAMHGEAGHDIVCAAVSSLVYTAIASMERVVKLKPEQYEYQIKSRGQAQLKLVESKMSPKQAHDAQLVAEVLETGLLGIAQENGPYIEVRYRRCKNVKI
ncbi:MAG: ribosomal-processing cysteine protease Prp [Tissierellia bacterium]|nr:ribosomal-processing cysteine protease Prp [Tissierellia bacterium]